LSCINLDARIRDARKAQHGQRSKEGSRGRDESGGLGGFSFKHQQCLANGQAMNSSVKRY
jgi:hypothetical protein